MCAFSPDLLKICERQDIGVRLTDTRQLPVRTVVWRINSMLSPYRFSEEVWRTSIDMLLVETSWNGEKDEVLIYEILRIIQNYFALFFIHWNTNALHFFPWEFTCCYQNLCFLFFKRFRKRALVGASTNICLVLYSMLSLDILKKHIFFLRSTITANKDLN